MRRLTSLDREKHLGYCTIRVTQSPEEHKKLMMEREGGREEEEGEVQSLTFLGERAGYNYNSIDITPQGNTMRA